MDQRGTRGASPGRGAIFQLVPTPHTVSFLRNIQSIAQEIMAGENDGLTMPRSTGSRSRRPHSCRPPRGREVNSSDWHMVRS
jgi:hypothetical protein